MPKPGVTSLSCCVCPQRMSDHAQPIKSLTREDASATMYPPRGLSHAALESIYSHTPGF